MNHYKTLLRLLIIVLASVNLPSKAQHQIKINSPLPPPEWALLEREILKSSAEGCRLFADTYLDDRGYLLSTEHWGGNDGPDDAMENFQNWPLLHALGAPESVLKLYKKAWEGHLRQYSEAAAATVPETKDGMYHKEFIISFDWEHNGEGLAAFYFYGLSRPHDIVWQKRLRRFAGFYMNEDPAAPNYDPEHKIIRSLHNGSKGPKLTPATVHDWGGDPVPGDPMRLKRYETASNIKGDHPLNLCATTLAMNAYMIEGEEKYKSWLLEYASAWKDRILANNGNIPTNIGLDGTIGGEWEGNWYGGVFGWNFWPQSNSRNYYRRGPRIAFGNALLLTHGDQSWIDVLRMQCDNIHAAARYENGEKMLPNKHGDQGWYGFRPANYQGFEHDIYLWSMNRSDRKRLEDDKWFQFLEGNNPDYPVEALKNEFLSLQEDVRGIMTDTTTPDTRNSDYPQPFNPAKTSVLVQLMLGGNNPGGQGGLLHSRLRYFDPVKLRAGIPEDVAALVTEIKENLTKVTLINLSQIENRNLIVQTGAYGEHQCLRVETGEKSYEINRRFFKVNLGPGCGTELIIYHKPYANQPTLALPWHGRHVPKPL